MGERSKPSRLRLALPKGRVLGDVQSALSAAGLAPAEDLTSSRKLVSTIPTSPARIGSTLEVLLLKNVDVPVYVEHGVADVGVAGTDLLYENGLSLLRPHTFPFRGCDIVLAGRPAHDVSYLRGLPIVHVATKYVRYARDYFARVGWPVEIIPLSGSVELAPVLGLADAIVDLMETGDTLRDNGLVAHAVIGESHLKLIVNRALSRNTTEAVERLIEALAGAESGSPGV